MTDKAAKAAKGLPAAANVKKRHVRNRPVNDQKSNIPRSKGTPIHTRPKGSR